MKDRFLVEQGPLGPRLVLTSKWQSEVYDYMRSHEIYDLYLNYARGWKGRDLKFLASMSWLKAFTILDWAITDVSLIHHLRNLELLEVSTYCKTEIRFDCFPRLEDCRLTWRERTDTLFQCTTLKHLFLSNYTRTSTDALGELTELETLCSASSAISDLRGLRPLKKLRLLGLYDLRRLRSLEGIEFLGQLETLEANECRALAGIAEVKQLRNLRRLELNDDGTLPSLKPIGDLRKLREVFFYGSTTILDGDLSPLARLPRLSKVSFQDRRHYSHKRDQIMSSTDRGHSVQGRA